MTKRLMILLAAALAFHADGGVENTVHNLSVSGPGQVKALSEEEICIFCHAPHRSTTRAPLWNRYDSRASYMIYDTSTLDALPGQPTGATRMCLSCHDGTVALGEIASRPDEIAFSSENRFLNPSTGSVETDLGDDHPVSFIYDEALASADSQIVSPSAIPPPVHLDEAGEMQCTACHDPHDDTYGNFLLLAPTGGVLCTSCHDRTGWPTSTHATSTATWNGTPPDPWPDSSDNTVADNACRSCHRPHSAPQPAWLIKRAPEEQACLDCHNGNVAGRNLEVDFSKTYRHPIALTSGVHDPAEDPMVAPRHVECSDCHNPHQSTGTTASAPFASGALRGVSGTDVNGAPVESVEFQYELCFNCHGDGTNEDQAIPRTAGEINTRLEFATDAISFHPVTQAGRNPDVPSLLFPWTESSQVYCTHCHASDTADQGGSAGPHGSDNRYLLRRRYETDDPVIESPEVYALCYECHSRDVLFSKMQSGFREHRKHVLGEDVSCSVCHDPHGVSAGMGTSANNSHLISFDTRVVYPFNGVIEFEDLGNRRGTCTLLCHGEKHDAERYGH